MQPAYVTAQFFVVDGASWSRRCQSMVRVLAEQVALNVDRSASSISTETCGRQSVSCFRPHGLNDASTHIATKPHCELVQSFTCDDILKYPSFWSRKDCTNPTNKHSQPPHFRHQFLSKSVHKCLSEIPRTVG